MRSPPQNWPGFEATLAWRTAHYRVVVENPDRVCRGVSRLRLDGVDIAAVPVTLLDDAATHLIEVTLRAAHDAADDRRVAPYPPAVNRLFLIG
jgi:cellobiose phosphorylase